MASGPMTSWKIDGETVGTMSEFILGGFKITADGLNIFSKRPLAEGMFIQIFLA